MTPYQLAVLALLFIIAMFQIITLLQVMDYKDAVNKLMKTYDDVRKSISTDSRINDHQI